ncbi:MAG TPA: GDP-mannose 4,6-dehydratase, partial [Actinomycetota bacterium]|nr:GDP-mannose 4,6-dehydratase [Actinomycetota bacterium]
MDSLADARVLVTGASGFIGSHLTRRLVAEKADVHALTSTVSSVFPVRLLDLREQLTLHEGSLQDRGAMDAIAARARPDVVFHLGAYTHVAKSWQRVDECLQANVQGTVNLLQALAGIPYRRFLYTGTSEIYGDVEVPFREDAGVNPVSPYSVSKYAGERYCRMFHRSYGWPIVMLRPFNGYGPGQSPDRIVPEIIVRGLRGQPIDMTEGRQTREFNYVADLVEGFVRAAVTPGVEGELFNLGCGEEISMRDLARTVLDAMGNPVEARFGALPERPTEIMRMYSDSTKARERLGWRPTHTLADGLEQTIAWYRAE